MSRRTLPRALFTALVAGAAAVQTAAALPPLKVEAVDDAALAGISGRYFGAQMLVGMRIDVVSQLHAPAAGSAEARGSLLVRRTGNGYDVRVDTAATAEPGAGAEAPASTAVAGGADGLRVNGIGQITQIAGDGNRLSNFASIRFVSDLDAAGDFNGLTHSQATTGPVSAEIRFVDGGMRLDLSGPGARLAQQLTPGQGGGLMQLGQIAGDGLAGSNRLHLQLATQLMPTLFQHQLGIHQALAGLSGIPR